MVVFVYSHDTIFSFVRMDLQFVHTFVSKVFNVFEQDSKIIWEIWWKQSHI